MTINKLFDIVFIFALVGVFIAKLVWKEGLLIDIFFYVVVAMSLLRLIIFEKKETKIIIKLLCVCSVICLATGTTMKILDVHNANNLLVISVISGIMAFVIGAVHPKKVE